MKHVRFGKAPCFGAYSPTAKRLRFDFATVWHIAKAMLQLACRSVAICQGHHVMLRDDRGTLAQVQWARAEDATLVWPLGSWAPPHVPRVVDPLACLAEDAAVAKPKRKAAGGVKLFVGLASHPADKKTRVTKAVSSGSGSGSGSTSD